jgi:Icc protein
MTVLWRISAVVLLGLLLARCDLRTAPASDSGRSTPAAILSATAAPRPVPTTAPTATAAPSSSAAPTPAPSATPAPTATPSPTATPAPQPWRFVVLGDTRTAGLRPPRVTYDLIEQARQAGPELVLAVGDMISALDDRASVREQWRRWRAAVAPLGASHLLVTPGNHDVQSHRWTTELLAEAFPELPSNGPPGFERLAYAFDYRGVRFISLHSEVFGDPHHLGAAQLDWLERQLQDNPNRYTIVFSHDPAFPVGPHIGSSLDVYPSERDRLWQLLGQYHVTAYIAGHEHLYNHQRRGGVDQVIAGTSGSSIYRGYGGEFYHYLVCEVGADGISVVVYDLKGSERDRFVLP